MRLATPLTLTGASVLIPGVGPSHLVADRHLPQIWCFARGNLRHLPHVQITTLAIRAYGWPAYVEGPVVKSATMRGTGLGAVSYESDRHAEAPECEIVHYACSVGHQSVIPFSIEAEEIPLTWMCRCGREAAAVNEVPKMAFVTKVEQRVLRTHWDMLLERRTIADLQELLTERLALLRNQEAEQRLSA